MVRLKAMYGLESINNITKLHAYLFMKRQSAMHGPESRNSITKLYVYPLTVRTIKGTHTMRGIKIIARVSHALQLEGDKKGG